MDIKSNVSLKPFNTFSVEAKAQYFVDVSTEEELKEVLDAKSQFGRMYFLGGGSNVLFVCDFDGLILKISIEGLNIIAETDRFVDVHLGAGENWHKFVTWAVEHEYDGVENMALIPGNVGGAVVGNIAAYGQNLSDVLVSVDVMDSNTKNVRVYSKDECELQYRSSLFKRARNLIILGATLRLRKQYDRLETSYHERKGRFGSLEEELQSFATPPYTVRNIYDAVIRIRKKKLPDPAEQGTVGSYFINPMVSKEKYVELSKIIPELQSYPVEDLQYTRTDWKEIKDSYVKIPAGRLLDELGWLGKWEGNVGVSSKHALNVVTNKLATGKEIFDFAEKMIKSVRDAYGIVLVSEIDIIK